MPRRRSTIAKELSPRLVRLIEAAKHLDQSTEGARISGIPRALEEFGTLARWIWPVHGLFVPNNSVVSTAIERIAKQHLALEEARQGFRDALNVVESFAQRDEIASAQNVLQTQSDEAYFYAGLALGVTLIDVT